MLTKIINPIKRATLFNWPRSLARFAEKKEEKEGGLFKPPNPRINP